MRWMAAIRRVTAKSRARPAEPHWARKTSLCLPARHWASPSVFWNLLTTNAWHRRIVAVPPRKQSYHDPSQSAQRRRINFINFSLFSTCQPEFLRLIRSRSGFRINLQFRVQRWNSPSCEVHVGNEGCSPPKKRASPASMMRFSKSVQKETNDFPTVTSRHAFFSSPAKLLPVLAPRPCKSARCQAS